MTTQSLRQEQEAAVLDAVTGAFVGKGEPVTLTEIIVEANSRQRLGPETKSIERLSKGGNPSRLMYNTETDGFPTEIFGSLSGGHTVFSFKDRLMRVLRRLEKQKRVVIDIRGSRTFIVTPTELVNF